MKFHRDGGLYNRVIWLLILLLAGLFIYPILVSMGEIAAEFPAGIKAMTTGPIAAALPNVLYNTAVVVVGGALLALVLGTAVAWVSERTDAELGFFGELLPLSSLLVPPIAGVIGWAVLLDPRAGLLNHLLQFGLRAIGINVTTGPINIYTMTSMVVILALYQVPYVFLIVSAALRSIDPAMEEASRVFAAGPMKTLLRVTLPAIRPSLASAALLAIVAGISQFSVPLVLGASARVDVLSVFIFRLLSNYPPQTAASLMLAFGMVATVQILLLVQRWISPPGRNAAITGRGFRNARMELGGWRLPVKGLVIAYLLVTALLPIFGLALVSLQPFWSAIINWGALSFQNYIEVMVNNHLTSRGLINSLMLGVATATICMFLGGVIMLHFQQRQTSKRPLADSLMSLSATVPHTVIGVAFLLGFSVAPFRLYGTILLLLLAYICIGMPYAARAASSAAAGIGAELAEASRVFRASEGRTFRRILLPLALPGLIAGWIIVFIHTVGDVTASALLSGVGNPAIGRELMELWTFASFPQVAALALVMTAISAVFVGLMLIVSRRSATGVVG